jgi:4-amino-4-deoxy-L-arabinose transferase-like glycosyltransferase
MTSIPRNGITHDKYWQLDPEQRAQREKGLKELPDSWVGKYDNDAMPAYEASQPPLYYWLMTASLKVLPHTSLVERVWSVRILTLFLASLAIPIGYVLTLSLFRNQTLAIAIVAMVSVVPGLALASSRVSNESLAIPLYSLLLLTVIAWLREPRRHLAVAVGTLLGLGLLTKAYFLTAVPAVIVLYFWCASKSRRHNDLFVQLSIILGIAFAVSGWWYARNYIQTGTFSGLDEALMLRNMGISEKILKALGVNWIQAVATIMLSHIWYGGWSLLALPKWIYFLGFGFFAVCAFGVARIVSRSRTPEVFMLLSFYGLFWIGQLYHVAMLFISKGSSTSMGGWYLYSTIWAEVALGIAGLLQLVGANYRKHVLAVLLVATAAVDVYGLHVVSIPYYTQSSAIWLSDLSRLLINKPTFIAMKELSFLWVGYILSTVTIVALGIRALRKTDFGEYMLSTHSSMTSHNSL